MEKEIKQIKDGIEKLLERANQSNESAKKVSSVCNLINNSWSGSDLVGHADFYYGDFDTPPHNSRFSVEWGLIHGVPEGWSEKSNEEVLQKIESGASILPEKLDNDADFIANEFDKLRKQTIILFSGISKEAATEIEQFNLRTKIDIFNQYWKRQIMTRDSKAIYAGRKIPTHKYYEATASFITGVAEQLNEFLYLIDKVVAQNKSTGQKVRNENVGRIAYVDKSTFLRLNKIESDNFDLSRLIALCNELDDNYSLENYHSCAMLLRAIFDHIPPIFGKKSFEDVCAQHGGRSFKDIMRPLNETAKKIGDDYLHTQISKKVLAVTKTQVSFQANLDTLLNEVAAILEQK
ncbi:MAG: hypothetical protein NUV64_03820 [Parcubacteria group bacterium]|nr:hypothetical protein [Parcubacteria group bacterium]